MARSPGDFCRNFTANSIGCGYTNLDYVLAC